MSSSLAFASSNHHKFSEAKEILAEFGIRLDFFRCELTEIQSQSIGEIAEHKSVQAFGLCGAPVLVEDAALHVDSLGGFPGPYSSYVFGTLGNRGILKLVGRNRQARFVSAASYCDGAMMPRTFSAEVLGDISAGEAGTGWGYDPIFVPRGHALTYAQMGDKSRVSHRRAALEKFARWFRRTPESVGR